MPFGLEGEIALGRENGNARTGAGISGQGGNRTPTVERQLIYRHTTGGTKHDTILSTKSRRVDLIRAVRLSASGDFTRLASRPAGPDVAHLEPRTLARLSDRSKRREAGRSPNDRIPRRSQGAR